MPAFSPKPVNMSGVRVRRSTVGVSVSTTNACWMYTLSYANVGRDVLGCGVGRAVLGRSVGLGVSDGDGSRVGARVGAAEGDALGSMLGSCDGTNDVGRCVGLFVGVDVGCGVGLCVVGRAVGSAVGEYEGAGVGAGVGTSVGFWVGAWVGTMVGTAVGAAVGALVGRHVVVGTSVGVCVGIAVGCSVGKRVGAAVGIAVGEAEGAGVGEGVGRTVGLSVGVGEGARDAGTSKHPRHTRRSSGSAALLQAMLARHALQHCALRSALLHLSQGVRRQVWRSVVTESLGFPTLQDSRNWQRNLPSAPTVQSPVLTFRRIASRARSSQPEQRTRVRVAENGARPAAALRWFSAHVSQHSTSSKPLQSVPHGYSTWRVARVSTTFSCAPSHLPLLLPMLGTASLHDIFSVTGSVVQSDAAAASVAS